MLAKIKKLLPASLEKKLPRKVKVVSISRRTSHRINLKFRAVDRSANVISFRYGADYGEILVCPEVVRLEAKEQGHSYKYQLAWMIVHGILHLAGMHHEYSRTFEKRVGKLESTILKKIFANSK